MFKKLFKNRIFKFLNIFKIIRILRFRHTANNNYRISYLRSKGVKIGERCLINYIEFTADPYLVEIGDEVAIARFTRFITHDGSTWLFKDKSQEYYVFGKITIGNNCFIGENCLILTNTQIGNNCIIGAGSVVRGKIPDNSVVFGNPAKVVMKTSLAEKFLMNNKGLINQSAYTPEEKRKLLTELLNLKS
jgi:acetyltransferase-like isoleucine patch superfamily enzyme